MIKLKLTAAVATFIFLPGWSVAAPSNEDFARQVKELRKTFAQDPKAVQAAKEMCDYLPPQRAMEEPKCVALVEHIRASSTRSASGVPRF